MLIFDNVKLLFIDLMSCLKAQAREV